jgi:hypothetical protein
MGSGELLHVTAEYIRLIKSKCPHMKYSKYEINIISIFVFNKIFSL